MLFMGSENALNTQIIDQAFILAAGMGSRLRPYTDHCPKPLVKVAGKAIIDHIIDRMVQSGVRKIGINIHYKSEMIRDHLSTRADVQITFFEEDKLLDTGGGILNALPFFEGRPFYVSSGDSLWIDNPKSINALDRLSKNWSETEDKKDLSLLLQPVQNMHLTKGVGDYKFMDNSKPVRAPNKDGGFMFTSVRICHPRLFDDCQKLVFSFLALMDKAESEDRLSAVIHDGDWHHISTPEELEAVDVALSKHIVVPVQERRA